MTSTTSPDRTRPAAGPENGLRRSMGLGLTVLYGIGVTVGAGIYVLIGAAAGKAGPAAPLAFIIAGLVMALTACSFAELVGRMPVSAGEAAYVRAGFASDRLGLSVGLLVIGAALVAAAAIAHGGAGYIRTLTGGSIAAVASLVLIAMGAVAGYGMLASARLAGLMTLIEVGGLVAVVAFGLAARPDALSGAVTGIVAGGFGGIGWTGVIGASLLAFFAFIGFEGLVNIAEEVKEPAKTLPRAIFVTLAVSTLLYVLVILVALSAVSREELASSAAPLALVFERVAHMSPLVVTLIAIVASLNGIIAQIVLAARVIFGLAGLGVLPARLGSVHPRTHTPLIATVLATGAAIALAVAFPIDRLANATSFIMLVIFTLVNIALVLIKRRGEAAPPGTFVAPMAVPVAGALSCTGLAIAALAV